MKFESRILNVVAVVFFSFAAVYLWWSEIEYHRPEWAGTIVLSLSGTMCGMLGLFFVFVARRIPPRHEDRQDAEIADGAGVVGFFSPGSYWPFGLALASATAGLGLALWQMWLVAVGIVTVLIGTSGLVFEYYTGARHVDHS